LIGARNHQGSDNLSGLFHLIHIVPSTADPMGAVSEC
jgi:hypothetical protein